MPRGLLVCRVAEYTCAIMGTSALVSVSRGLSVCGNPLWPPAQTLLPSLLTGFWPHLVMATWNIWCAAAVRRSV